jgi:transcriptional regulator with XRE-family HTH domain
LADRRKKQIQPAFGPEKAFGLALRDIRTERGISQEQLALDGDFDRTFPSLIERGLRSPSIRTLVRLAEVLKVRPSEIVRRMELLMDKQKGTSKRPPRGTT